MSRDTRVYEEDISRRSWSTYYAILQHPDGIFIMFLLESPLRNREDVMLVLVAQVCITRYKFLRNDQQAINDSNAEVDVKQE
jgi:hypothetical protein